MSDVAYSEDASMKPVDFGQVFGQVERLNEIVQRLFKVEETIEGKLQPILREHYPSPASGEEETPSMVPLAMQLFNINETLSRLHYRLVEVDERISL